VSKSVIAGQPVTLGGNAWDLSSWKAYVAGAMFAAVRLDKPGDADHGKFWDATGAGSWQAAPALWPSATYTRGSWWAYALPAAATTGKAGSYVQLTDLSDDLTDPSLTATTCSRDCQGAAITAGGTLGLRSVTIHAHTVALVSVSDMTVCVYDSGVTNLISRQITDAGGNVVLSLDDGTYAVRFAKAGYVAASGTIVVAVDATFVFVVTAIAAPAAASPDLCTVYGYALDAGGVPVNGETISFYGLAPLGVLLDVVVTTPASVMTGPSALHPAWTPGYFEIDLLRLSQIKTSSRLAKLDGLVIDIPNAASAALATLVEAAK